MCPNPITEVKNFVLGRREKLRKRRAVPPPLPGRTRTWKYLRPDELAGFENLFFAARRIVEGHYAGKHKSPYKGSAPEFVDYRQYHPGDEMRTIDWKAYAKTDRYYVKLFEKETDMNCYILLDASASMAFDGRAADAPRDPSNLSKLAYASYLTAALTYLMVKQGDKVGLTVFDRKIRTHHAPGGTFSHMHSLLNVLENTQPGDQTSISKTLERASGLFRRRGLLIVISDLLDDPEAVFRALSMYSHRNFEIIIFHVLHEDEYSLPSFPNANFIDSESYAELTCMPADIRESYALQIQEFIATMETMSRARGIDYNFVSTATPYSAVLEKYLHRRKALSNRSTRSGTFR